MEAITIALTSHRECFNSAVRCAGELSVYPDGGFGVSQKIACKKPMLGRQNDRRDNDNGDRDKKGRFPKSECLFLAKRIGNAEVSLLAIENLNIVANRETSKGADER
jgi:hypothetical protein